MEYQQAKLVVLDNPNQTGRSAKGEIIPVMYNPTDYVLTWNSNITRDKNNNLQFNNASRGNFTINLFFDSYDKKQDVRKVEFGTDTFLKLMEAKVPKKGAKRPKICLFIWGQVYYKGIISKIEQKFTMFLPNGTPVRAELRVELEPYINKKEQKKNSSLSNSRKFWTVVEGDRLDVIADKALGDVNLWREIALENKISNPLEFPGDFIGKTLIIPHV